MSKKDKIFFSFILTLLTIQLTGIFTMGEGWNDYGMALDGVLIVGLVILAYLNQYTSYFKES